MSSLSDNDPAQWADEQAQVISMEDLPVFQQGWWVEIARGTAHLNEAQVIEGNIVVGRLSAAPCPLGRGPVTSRDLSGEAKAELHQLLAQLPRNISLRFVCRPDSVDAELIREAFKAAGFEQSRQIRHSQPPMPRA